MLKKLSNSFSKMPYELVFSFVLITTMFHLSCSAHYCNLKNCKGKPHTMCKYSVSIKNVNYTLLVFNNCYNSRKNRYFVGCNYIKTDNVPVRLDLVFFFFLDVIIKLI